MKGMLVPARYAKAIAAIVVGALSYIQVYGLVWHTGPAIGGILVALGVFGIPNAPKPPPAGPAA